jgi:hypothetical protein
MRATIPTLAGPAGPDDHHDPSYAAPARDIDNGRTRLRPARRAGARRLRTRLTSAPLA